MRLATRHTFPRRQGPALLLAASVWLFSGCSDDPYERAVESPEAEHDPTSGPVDPPPAETAQPANEEREPMDVDDAAAIDPAGTPMTGSAEPPPEDARRAPLDHPSRAETVDVIGEPVDAATPDEPTRSLDPTESPAVDPVGEPGDGADGNAGR